MATTKSRKASSSNDGFFQPVPEISNQFHDDTTFQRVLSFFLPENVINSISSDFDQFGEAVVSKQVLDWVTDAERNVPYLKGGGRDAFGRSTSELVVTEGWRRLQSFGIEQGIVAAGYEGAFGEHTRVVQFLKTHLWTGSCANVTCPSAMTDGAAKLLQTHLSSQNLDAATRRVFQDAYDRLTSRDSKTAWTSGQWMTERKGGSDVSGTETLATYTPSLAGSTGLDIPVGPWTIDGFKWFSSATDSSMVVLLAQTPKGLSTFFAPMRRLSTSSGAETELNGISIQRLKNKFGTKSLPTAELELKNMQAWLIGKEGNGIPEISTILNITRLYSAVSTVGYAGRGLAIARAFARVREVGAGKGKRVMLKDTQLHMSSLAKLTGEYHAMMLFTFFVAWLIGISEHKSGPHTSRASRLRPIAGDVPLLLRVLTPILKGAVCKRSTHVLQECMEALGGVGYLDNSESEAINIARLYRDCLVNSIWEGTTDVLASDTVRVLKGRNGGQVLNALNRWISGALATDKSEKFVAERKGLQNSWKAIRDEISSGAADDILSLARDLLFRLADIIMGVLLVVDSESKTDPAITRVCLRYLKDKGIVERNVSSSRESWKSDLEVNQRIVYGNEVVDSSLHESKL